MAMGDAMTPDDLPLAIFSPCLGVPLPGVARDIALSTIEAEYVAMSRCAQQMVWMQMWLDEVEIDMIYQVLYGVTVGGRSHRYSPPLPSQTSQVWGNFI